MLHAADIRGSNKYLKNLVTVGRIKDPYWTRQVPPKPFLILEQLSFIDHWTAVGPLIRPEFATLIKKLAVNDCLEKRPRKLGRAQKAKLAQKAQKAQKGHDDFHRELWYDFNF